MAYFQPVVPKRAETPVSFSAEFLENDRILEQNLLKTRTSLCLLGSSNELAGGECVCLVEVRECDMQARGGGG